MWRTLRRYIGECRKYKEATVGGCRGYVEVVRKLLESV
jgi:hypothetical protein